MVSIYLSRMMKATISRMDCLESFLAINNLSNQPYESRKFPLDSELKPTSHAPSRGPDLLMEFDEFTLVIEVTWTASARQVAAEESQL